MLDRYSRTVNRTVLTVVEVPFSNLANGHARTTGMDTRYTVRAMANRSRDAVTLGTFDTLARAREYVDAYSPAYGLLG